MKDVSRIPHRPAPGLCPVNGIRDLIQWRSGRDWSNQFLHGLGGGGGFAYLRFNAADPPRQVYWGVAGPRQHAYLADLLGAEYKAIENRTFKFSWRKAREALDAGIPPVLGPLDMFYLPFYPGIYRQRHIPIHYLLLVGYDEENVHVYDTGQEALQTLPREELQQAWDVNVPGLGKRNRLVILDIPPDPPPTELLIQRSVADQCRTMLRPPVSMLGVPAMKKLVREIARWPAELGKERAAASLRQVREYLNSPPDLAGDHLTAGRDLYVAFLDEAGPMAGLDFSGAADRLRTVIEIIPQLAETLRKGRLEEAGTLFGRIAQVEVEAYTELSAILALEDLAPG
jgi:hypothetical protein